MAKWVQCLMLVCLMVAAGSVRAALTVPTDVQQPGTQPGEIGNLESPNKCDNCHGGYDAAVEPAHNWRGSMMAHAGRDPIFWATLAVAEQDFDGSGDLCIRCHSTGGWLAGRSTPTDGSGLAAGDADGVECDFCHALTNPDNSEHLGVMNPPFVANEPNASYPNGTEGYYGSGMTSMWDGSDKLGPYSDAKARHQWMQSQYHRSVDFCGTCHDVSNPVVGNLAHNNGMQPTGGPVIDDDTPGGAVNGKAAFNNPPYKYGIVERTFSEYKAGLLSQTKVDDYPSLPADLKGGALQTIYTAAYRPADGTADYEDGTPRYYSCQSCHLPPVTGQGCDKNPPTRSDLPLHDMTGGNYWMPQAIQYLDGLGKLRLGGGLTTAQTDAMNDGIVRARAQLNDAATLTVIGDTLKVINHTGHKLISGYPEGRRMWLNIRWYAGVNQLPREDGAYGPLVDGGGAPVTVANPAGGPAIQVESILDLDDPNTKIYEAHMGMTQAWAAQLVALDAAHYGPIVLDYDRLTGAPDTTIADLAGMDPGSAHETFHFVLNNSVLKDNRIPTYGMSYDIARERNALPVPADQYGDPGSGGAYNYWDELTLNPPPGATRAEIDLLYQPTSWEYIQFLYLANNGGNAFLADEGVNMLQAWLNTGMAAPHVMASTEWVIPDTDGDGVINPNDNCPDTFNPDQLNTDGDGLGDACDPDDDNDLVLDGDDNCPLDANPGQEDNEADGLGDVCDPDDDNDGLTDVEEGALGTNPLNADTDGDGLNDGVDPIPLTFNHNDGDLAPLGSPGGGVNAADIMVCQRIALGLVTATALELAHGDLYPPGAPNGLINLQDCLLLMQLVL